MKTKILALIAYFKLICQEKHHNQADISSKAIILKISHSSDLDSIKHSQPPPPKKKT
jgi:hypothetical protein